MAYYGAKIITLTWLGTMEHAGQFVEFVMVIDVKRVAGMPPTSAVNAAVTCREGPMTMPDATPIATPGLSPFVMGTVVDMLCAGAHMNSTLYAAGIPIGCIEILGYGMGTGPAGVGVKQTSGAPVDIPIICVFANMVHPT